MIPSPSMSPEGIAEYQLKAAAVEASLMAQIFQKAVEVDSSHLAMKTLRDLKGFSSVGQFLKDGSDGKWTIKDLAMVVAALDLKVDLTFHNDSKED